MRVAAPRPGAAGSDLSAAGDVPRDITAGQGLDGGITAGQRAKKVQGAGGPECQRGTQTFIQSTNFFLAERV